MKLCTNEGMCEEELIMVHLNHGKWFVNDWICGWESTLVEE